MRRRIRQDHEADDCDVWPENVDAVDLFLSCNTQWRIGFGGATGLDYAGVEATMRLRGIRRADREDLFWRLQVIERAALIALAERADAGRVNLGPQLRDRAGS